MREVSFTPILSTALEQLSYYVATFSSFMLRGGALRLTIVVLLGWFWGLMVHGSCFTFSVVSAAHRLLSLLVKQISVVEALSPAPRMFSSSYTLCLAMQLVVLPWDK